MFPELTMLCKLCPKKREPTGLMEKIEFRLQHSKTFISEHFKKIGTSGWIAQLVRAQAVNNRTASLIPIWASKLRRLQLRL